MSDAIKVTIDDIEYSVPLDNVPANQILGHIRSVDFELGRVQAQIAIYQTARKAYFSALKSTLKQQPRSGDENIPLQTGQEN